MLNITPETKSLIALHIPTSEAKGNDLTDEETSFALAVLQSVAYRIRHANEERIEKDFYFSKALESLMDARLFIAQVREDAVEIGR